MAQDSSDLKNLLINPKRFREDPEYVQGLVRIAAASGDADMLRNLGDALSGDCVMAALLKPVIGRSAITAVILSGKADAVKALRHAFDLTPHDFATSLNVDPIATDCISAEVDAYLDELKKSSGGKECTADQFMDSATTKFCVFGVMCLVVGSLWLMASAGVYLGIRF